MNHFRNREIYIKMGRVPFTELAPLAYYSIEKVIPLRIISFTVGFSLVRKPSHERFFWKLHPASAKASERGYA